MNKIQIVGNAAGNYGFQVVDSTGAVYRGPFIGLADEATARASALGYAAASGAYAGVGGLDASKFEKAK